MDNEQSGAAASSISPKHTDKKDTGFFKKTAFSIRDTFQELSDDVKGKTHNLTHGINLKKKKKNKEQKIKNAEYDAPSQSPTARKKSLPTESSDDDHANNTSPSQATKCRNVEPLKALPISSEQGKNDAEISTRPETSSDEAVISSSSKRQSKDHIDPTSPSKKSSDNPSFIESTNHTSNTEPTQSTTTKTKSHNASEKESTPSSEQNNNDRIHISFDGVVTVDNLLCRIDEAIEKAEIVIEGATSKIPQNVKMSPNSSKPLSSNDHEDFQNTEHMKQHDQQNEQTPSRKKKSHYAEAKAGNDLTMENEEKPIRLDYNELHCIEDILLKIQNEPGHRRVVLENVPPSASSSGSDSKITSQSSTIDTTLLNSDSAANTFTTLKTSPQDKQDSSVLTTSSIASSSCQNDQIHVDIDNVQSVGDLLDRIDNAVQHAPILINSNVPSKKRKAPLAANKPLNDDQQSRKNIAPTEKQEQPVSDEDHSTNKVKPRQLPSEEEEEKNNNDEHKDQTTDNDSSKIDPETNDGTNIRSFL